LLDHLKQGRYLIETRGSTAGLYVCVLKENLFYKHYCLHIPPRPLYLKLDDAKASVKKVIYERLNKTEQKKIFNDPNVGNYLVSEEYFEKMIQKLEESNSKLCQSLNDNDSNQFRFAVI
jgi:hypothetical protein